MVTSTMVQSFPGGKENRVDLPASPAPHGFTSYSSDQSLCVESWQSSARRGVTRKVLRSAIWLITMLANTIL